MKKEQFWVFREHKKNFERSGKIISLKILFLAVFKIMLYKVQNYFSFIQNNLY